MQLLKSAGPQHQLFDHMMKSFLRQFCQISLAVGSVCFQHCKAYYLSKFSDLGHAPYSELCYKFVYCCNIRYFLIIAKCFTKSSKRFRWKAMFENECSAREYTVLGLLELPSNWRQKQPRNLCGVDFGGSRRTFQKSVTQVEHLFLFLYRTTWLLFMLRFNGTPVFISFTNIYMLRPLLTIHIEINTSYWF
jgi:hypothetical protein